MEREEGGDNAVSTPTGPVLVEWTEPVSSPISQGKRWSLEEAATVAGHSGSMFPHCVYPGAQVSTGLSQALCVFLSGEETFVESRLACYSRNTN